jgi:hypothetical protein
VSDPRTATVPVTWKLPSTVPEILAISPDQFVNFKRPIL